MDWLYDAGLMQRNAKNNEAAAIPKLQEKETAAPVHLNKADFLKKVYNYEASPNEWKYLGNRPAIIDFYADWCGPCKMIAPHWNNLPKNMPDRSTFTKSM